MNILYEAVKFTSEKFRDIIKKEKEKLIENIFKEIEKLDRKIEVDLEENKITIKLDVWQKFCDRIFEIVEKSFDILESKNEKFEMFVITPIYISFEKKVNKL